MAIGLGLLRLPPRDFWAMTLPEFAAALRGLKGVNTPEPPLERGTFASLMALFPDDEESFPSLRGGIADEAIQ
jgi:uncharacterized phage protein (TIGR02216 family)